MSFCYKRCILFVSYIGLASVESDELVSVERHGLTSVESDEFVSVERDGLASVDRDGFPSVESNELASMERDGLASVDLFCLSGNFSIDGACRYATHSWRVLFILWLRLRDFLFLLLSFGLFGGGFLLSFFLLGEE